MAVNLIGDLHTPCAPTMMTVGNTPGQQKGGGRRTITDLISSCCLRGDDSGAPPPHRRMIRRRRPAPTPSSSIDVDFDFEARAPARVRRHPGNCPPRPADALAVVPRRSRCLRRHRPRGPARSQKRLRTTGRVMPPHPPPPPSSPPPKQRVRHPRLADPSINDGNGPQSSCPPPTPPPPPRLATCPPNSMLIVTSVFKPGPPAPATPTITHHYMSRADESSKSSRLPCSRANVSDGGIVVVPIRIIPSSHPPPSRQRQHDGDEMAKCGPRRESQREKAPTGSHTDPEVIVR